MTSYAMDRATVEHEADLAAQRAVLYGCEQPNNYFPGSDAAIWWKACYVRFLLCHSTRGVIA